jgi:acetyl-CoA C-acetyltransferase
VALSVVIAGAKRTPIGRLGGGLSGLSAAALGAAAISAALADARIEAEDVDEAILGQVLTGGAGMNPARQAALAAGLGMRAPAMTINQVCGSGLRAVVLGAQQIETGGSRIVVAGGQESMSNAPHLAVLRAGKKLGDFALVDSVMRDGLTDAALGYPMGATAETIARSHGISREAQDAFALASHRRAAAASEAGRFEAELTVLAVPGGKTQTIVREDEAIRRDTSLEALAHLRPAFDTAGSVTSGNSSGINDGAAAVVLLSESDAEARDLTPLARLAGWAHVGLDPAVMGLGPIGASRQAVQRAGWNIEDVDLWEINEAFAAQSLAVIGELGIDANRVNVNGGAVALGHPIGASGARILVTLLHEMRRRRARRGIATLCIGGGMGIAACFEGLW